MAVKRISLRSIIHEVLHFFTHFENGLPYTIRKLLSEPGAMQKRYVDGERKNFQKPFSLYFLTASFSALALYWINRGLMAYFDAGNSLEADFFHNYWVMLQVGLLPIYTLITFLFFKNSRFNYAEILVQQLYLFSIIFLMTTAIHLLKFIFPELQTRYIELPAIIFYCIITNLNFFDEKKLIIIGKTILAIAINFLLASQIQDLFIARH